MCLEVPTKIYRNINYFDLDYFVIVGTVIAACIVLIVPINIFIRYYYEEYNKIERYNNDILYKSNFDDNLLR